MNKVISTGLVLGAALSLIGCGGGGPSSSDSTGIGYYEDSGIIGVHYKCGSEEGVTGVDGKFNFEFGKECTFSLGKLTLDKFSADSMYGNDSHFQIQADDMTIMLLSAFDKDNDLSNGFDIDTKAAEEALKLLTGDKIKKDDLAGVLESYAGELGENSEYKEPTIEELNAKLKAHQEARQKEILAGKKFYIPEIRTDYKGGTYKSGMSTWEFDKKLELLTVVRFEDKEIFKVKIMLKGNILVLDDTTNMKIEKFIKDLKVKLSISDGKENTGKYTRTLYTKKEAQKKLDEWKERRVITAEKIRKAIVGKTLYGVTIYGENYKELSTTVFASDGTVTRVEEGREGKETITGTYVIDKDTIIMKTEDGELSVKVRYISPSQIRTYDDDHEVIRSYYDKAKAEKHPNYSYGGGSGGGGSGASALETHLAGNTLYFVSHDGMTKAVFNGDLTEVTTTDYKKDGTPKGTSDTDSVHISDEKLIINESGDYLKFHSNQGDYQLWDLFDSHNTLKEQIRVYSDETKAKSYLAE